MPVTFITCAGGGWRARASRTPVVNETEIERVESNLIAAAHLAAVLPAIAQRITLAVVLGETSPVPGHPRWPYPFVVLLLVVIVVVVVVVVVVLIIIVDLGFLVLGRRRGRALDRRARHARRPRRRWRAVRVALRRLAVPLRVPVLVVALGGRLLTPRRLCAALLKPSKSRPALVRRAVVVVVLRAVLLLLLLLRVVGIRLLDLAPALATRLGRFARMAPPSARLFLRAIRVRRAAAEILELAGAALRACGTALVSTSRSTRRHGAAAASREEPQGDS